MTLNSHHVAEIVDLLMDHGISPFCVMIRSNGTVLFHSQGLTEGDVCAARRELGQYLVCEESAQKVKYWPEK